MMNPSPPSLGALAIAGLLTAGTLVPPAVPQAAAQSVGAQSVGVPRGGPPQEALDACRGRAADDPCSFETPRGTLEGHCFEPPPGGLVCAPEGHRGPPGAGARGQGTRPPTEAFASGPRGQGQGQGAYRQPRGYTPAGVHTGAVPLSNRLSDTGQITCFDDSGPIRCPAEGAAFHGQDAHYASRSADLRDNGDGTVSDPTTGLLWQQGHDGRRLTFTQAQLTCASLRLGGRGDWRLPSIKELFSISHWQGVTGQRPFLDARFFDIAPPSARAMENDRVPSHHPDMMGQTWSSTLYQGDHWDRPGVESAFFFNFLDGRIKQAPVRGPMALFVRCVAGPEWGTNQFRDTGDGTVFDGLSGLTWQRSDDGRARPWKDALAYCQGLTLAGHGDWRLPNVKELQSIVDYSRPQPAIDTRVFVQRDPAAWFWSATTHGDDPRFATYVCFGRCTSTEGVDVHGAGAQRSDPKAGDPSRFGPRGGQRDATRILNAARCVRG